MTCIPSSWRPWVQMKTLSVLLWSYSADAMKCNHMLTTNKHSNLLNIFDQNKRNQNLFRDLQIDSLLPIFFPQCTVFDILKCLRIVRIQIWLWKVLDPFNNISSHSIDISNFHCLKSPSQLAIRFEEEDSNPRNENIFQSTKLFFQT